MRRGSVVLEVDQRNVRGGGVNGVVLAIKMAMKGWGAEDVPAAGTVQIELLLRDCVAAEAFEAADTERRESEEEVEQSVRELAAAEVTAAAEAAAAAALGPARAPADARAPAVAPAGTSAPAPAPADAPAPGGEWSPSEEAEHVAQIGALIKEIYAEHCPEKL